MARNLNKVYNLGVPKKATLLMRVIALIGNKGGAGKTTLAINMATVLNQEAPTLLLDADPQGSALHWSAMLEGENIPEVIDATDNTTTVINTHKDRASHVLVDCPPQLHAPQTREALQHVDLALIPVLPSPLDLWASVAVGDTIADIKKENPGLQALLVINQLEPRTRLSRMVQSAIQELDIPVATTTLHRRMVYRSSVLEGKSVAQMGSIGAAAADEIDHLLAEVSAL